MRSLPPIIVYGLLLTKNQWWGGTVFRALWNAIIHENTRSNEIDGLMEGWMDGCLDEMGRDGVGEWVDKEWLWELLKSELT